MPLPVKAMFGAEIVGNPLFKRGDCIVSPHTLRECRLEIFALAA